MSKLETKAIVPAVQSLPAMQVDAQTVDWGALNEKLKDELEKSYKKQRSDGVIARACVVGMLGTCMAFAIPVPMLMPLSLIPLAQFAFIGGKEQEKVNNLVPEAVEKAVAEMREQFRKAQIDVYTGQKRQILAAAEQHLAAGNLLSLEDAAWLGNLDPGMLKDATHKLSITALQIRQMLAHQRCSSFNSDGSRKVAKPFTFASEKLMPEFERHQHHLKRELLALGAVLAEDGLPVTQEMQLLDEVAPRTGYWKGVKDFVNPLFLRGMKREFTQAQLPRIKDIEVLALQPIADFAEALETYESQNTPLDLPAVRGWNGGRRKVLPGPKVVR